MTASVNARALEMRLAIKRLMVKHRVVPEPAPIPLTMPTQYPMLMEGYASTVDLDLDRTKLRRYAFGYPLPRHCKDVPLYYKHDPAQVAGTIQDLEYDAEGNLLIRAEVDHPLARRAGAFSIAACVLDYEMRDTDGPDFFAIINSAELTEISLTDTPSNPNALVMDRHRASPAVQCLRLMTERVTKLQKLTEFIKEQTHGDVH